MIFGIKCNSQEDPQHLIAAPQEFDKISIDWTGIHYCGFTFHWHYDQIFVDISMLGYISTLPSGPNHPSPKMLGLPTIGPPLFMTRNGNLFHLLITPHCNQILKLTSSNLAMAPCCSFPELWILICSLLRMKFLHNTSNSSYWINKTEAHAAPWLCSYSYQCSHQIQLEWYGLTCGSNAAYLLLPEACSQLAGHYVLRNAPELTCAVLLNGPILKECCTIKHMVASSAETETSALFHKCHKKSKAWGMCYWWLKYKVVQQNFKIFWKRVSIIGLIVLPNTLRLGIISWCNSSICTRPVQLYVKFWLNIYLSVPARCVATIGWYQARAVHMLQLWALCSQKHGRFR